MKLSFLSTTLLAAAVLASAVGCSTHPLPGEGESVVLIHGLGRTERSMMILGQRLVWAGYEVEIVGYPSREAPVSDHVQTLRDAIARCCAEAPRIHFVGHSLGGIVIRQYLAEDAPQALGRVVLLAPPSQGSELADWVTELELELARKTLGPAVAQLGTDSTDLPALLAPPEYDLGIIAGNRSINPIGSIVIPGPDDGMVGVQRARIEGVPVIVLPRNHAFIMHSRFTADAVMRFLRTGAFDDGGG